MDGLSIRPPLNDMLATSSTSTTSSGELRIRVCYLKQTGEMEMVDSDTLLLGLRGSMQTLSIVLCTIQQKPISMVFDFVRSFTSDSSDRSLGGEWYFFHDNDTPAILRVQYQCSIPITKGHSLL